MFNNVRLKKTAKIEKIKSALGDLTSINFLKNKITPKKVTITVKISVKMLIVARDESIYLITSSSIFAEVLCFNTFSA